MNIPEYSSSGTGIRNLEPCVPRQWGRQCRGDEIRPTIVRHVDGGRRIAELGSVKTESQKMVGRIGKIRGIDLGTIVSDQIAAAIAGTESVKAALSNSQQDAEDIVSANGL